MISLRLGKREAFSNAKSWLGAYIQRVCVSVVKHHFLNRATSLLMNTMREMIEGLVAGKDIGVPDGI